MVSTSGSIFFLTLFIRNIFCPQSPTLSLEISVPDAITREDDKCACQPLLTNMTKIFQFATAAPRCSISYDELEANSCRCLFPLILYLFITPLPAPLPLRVSSAFSASVARCRALRSTTRRVLACFFKYCRNCVKREVCEITSGGFN